jgi:hypothetical protein
MGKTVHGLNDLLFESACGHPNEMIAGRVLNNPGVGQNVSVHVLEASTGAGCKQHVLQLSRFLG